MPGFGLADRQLVEKLHTREGDPKTPGTVDRTIDGYLSYGYGTGFLTN